MVSTGVSRSEAKGVSKPGVGGVSTLEIVAQRKTHHLYTAPHTNTVPEEMHPNKGKQTGTARVNSA